MSTLLTIDDLEREVRYLREQNQKTLRELSTVIKENSALREKLHIPLNNQSTPSKFRRNEQYEGGEKGKTATNRGIGSETFLKFPTR